MIRHKKIKYRVSASVNPTRRANAKHTQVSSGRVPLYKKHNALELINFLDRAKIINGTKEAYTIMGEIIW